MAIITVDGNSEWVRWTADGRTTRTATSLEELVDRLDEPHAIICQPAFHHGLRDVRNILREMLAEDGHQLVAVSPGAEAVLEAAAGDRVAGSGAERLHLIVIAGARGIDWQVGRRHETWDVRDALDVVHAVDMFHETGGVAALAVAALGPYSALDEGSRCALGDGQDYRLDVILAAYRAASVATNRARYEQFLGLAAGSSGSAMTHTIRSWYSARNTSTDFERDSVLAWPDYRRALRGCFHRIAAARRHQDGAAD